MTDPRQPALKRHVVNFRTPESLPYLRLARVVMFCCVPALTMLAVSSIVLPVGVFRAGPGLIEHWRTVALFGALVPLIAGIGWIYRREQIIKFRERAGLCYFCGYDLRDAASGECPECGHELD